jgi:hypothetical protein
MAIGEFVTYARDFFRLAYPATWSVHENRLVGLTDFWPPHDGAGSYPAGIALMTLPETGISLDQLLRTGIFLLMRDLDAPSVQRLGAHHEGALEWYRLFVQGRASALPGGGPHLHITKHVALSRPGPGVLVLALYGPTETIEPLMPDFEMLLRSIDIVQ